MLCLNISEKPGNGEEDISLKAWYGVKLVRPPSPITLLGRPLIRNVSAGHPHPSLGWRLGELSLRRRRTDDGTPTRV